MFLREISSNCKYNASKIADFDTFNLFLSPQVIMANNAVNIFFLKFIDSGLVKLLNNGKPTCSGNSGWISVLEVQVTEIEELLMTQSRDINKQAARQQAFAQINKILINKGISPLKVSR